MTTVTFHKTKKGILKKFECIGHAGFAEAGEDIVCASISILVINTINSIEEIAKDSIEVTSDEEDGRITCSFPGEPNYDSVVLLKAMELGLTEISKQYRNFCRIKFQEV